MARDRAPREFRLRFPPILLENDWPLSPLAPEAPPRENNRLSVTPPTTSSGRTGELPEGYGTERLFLTARDPQWLYAHWDLTREQQRHYNACSADGHLVLRIHTDSPDGVLAAQAHVHPESRHWFVHVGRAGTQYVAELGYHRPGGRWSSICVSAATMTPPERMSADPSVRYATLPAAVSLAKLRPLTRTSGDQKVAPGESPLSLLATDPIQSEAVPGLFAPKLPVEAERELAETARVEPEVREESLAFTEMVAGGRPEGLASLAAVPVPPSATELGGISSTAGGPPAPPAKPFQLKVNAELVIYGATEPDAVGSIAGRPVTLRPDGSFSCRFALPDGYHALAVLATSANGADARWVDLEFTRDTRGGGGEVGASPLLPPPAHPQGGTLWPAPE